MRIVALALAIGLAGCSFLAARPNNDPHRGCSRTNARMDTAFALAGLVGIAALVTNMALDPPSEGDHGGTRYLTGLGVTALSIFSLFEGIQAAYGYNVADRCVAARAKLTAPVIVPGPPGALP